MTVTIMVAAEEVGATEAVAAAAGVGTLAGGGAGGDEVGEAGEAVATAEAAGEAALQEVEAGKLGDPFVGAGVWRRAHSAQGVIFATRRRR